MRKIFLRACIALLALLAASIFLWVVQWEAQDREKQSKDFKADIIASGFVLAQVEDEENPKVVDGGKRTDMVIEIFVVVDGCMVELERDYSEWSEGALPVAGERSGRKIEIYELDEGVNAKGKEIDIEGAPASPMPEQVLSYLGGHRDQFKHCLTQ